SSIAPPRPRERPRRPRSNTRAALAGPHCAETERFQLARRRRGLMAWLVRARFRQRRRDHDLDAAVDGAALGGVVGGDRAILADAHRLDRLRRDALADQEAPHLLSAQHAQLAIVRP